MVLRRLWLGLIVFAAVAVAVIAVRDKLLDL